MFRNLFFSLFTILISVYSLAEPIPNGIYSGGGLASSTKSNSSFNYSVIYAFDFPWIKAVWIYSPHVKFERLFRLDQQTQKSYNLIQLNKTVGTATCIQHSCLLEYIGTITPFEKVTLTFTYDPNSNSLVAFGHNLTSNNIFRSQLERDGYKTCTNIRSCELHNLFK